jgi:Domain of unknown function (DUF6306)
MNCVAKNQMASENRRMIDRPDEEPLELSSPACAMHEADDAYMGYAGAEELARFLNELLEAERAGARVALASAPAAGPFTDLLQMIEHDGMRWCAMLTRQLGARGVEPSQSVGAFFEKAMAVADLPARIIFLNRGQGSVVRKLRELLPRVRDEGLRRHLAEMLAEMLQAHEANIARANAVVAGAPD